MWTLLIIIVVVTLIFCGIFLRRSLLPKDTLYIKNISSNRIKHGGVVLDPGEDVTVKVTNREITSIISRS